jgi:hypothetical protein
VVLEAPSGVERKGDQVMAPKALFRATVTGGEGFTLAWIANGNEVREDAIDEDPFTRSYELTAPEGEIARLRVEIRFAGAPRTVTSHYWLSPDANPGPPVQSTAPKSNGCLGCASVEGTGALLGLALLRLLPRRRRPETRDPRPGPSS